MAALLFLVSRNHADILSHLSHEFASGDVHVLIDRRHGERRHTGDGGAAERERRGRERRARRATDHELHAIGYSIVTLQPPEGRTFERGLAANPAAVREVTRYLRERFRAHTSIPSWDAGRDGLGFVLLNGEGRPSHRLLFAKEFLDYYGSTGAESYQPSPRRVGAHESHGNGRPRDHPDQLLRNPDRRLVGLPQSPGHARAPSSNSTDFLTHPAPPSSSIRA